FLGDEVPWCLQGGKDARGGGGVARESARFPLPLPRALPLGHWYDCAVHHLSLLAAIAIAGCASTDSGSPSDAGPLDAGAGDVTWDGTCTDDGGDSYAVLSNGWKPYFHGNGACILAFDHAGACAGVATGCTTRVTYGAAWRAPAGHSASFDDVAGRVYSDGIC